MPAPQIAILAGPNGAGKTTLAPHLLAAHFAIGEFVNADTIAQGLSAFQPQSKAIEAGRILIGQLRRLADEKINFSFETTLASRSFAPWLETLRDSGYEINLFFLWLPSAEFAIERVRLRVARGGHEVPEDVIRRRYERGLSNFFSMYQQRAHYWQVYNGISAAGLQVIAEGSQDKVLSINDPEVWRAVQRRMNDGR